MKFCYFCFPFKKGVFLIITKRYLELKHFFANEKFYRQGDSSNAENHIRF